MAEQFVNKDLDPKEIANMYKKKRRKIKIKLATTSLIMCVVGMIFVFIYNCLNIDTYVNCVEKANIDYKAYLKENDFYDKAYLEKGTNVIASLIENIDTDFQYNMEFDQEIEYIYDYDITAKIEVLEGDEDDILLEKEEILAKVDNQLGKGNSLNIEKKLNIDYGAYNSKLENFVTTYSLKKAISSLVLTMHLHLINSYDGTQINKNEDVIKIKIPLTTQTVDIEIATNVFEGNSQVLINKKETKMSIIILYVGYTLLFMAFIELLRFIKYCIDVRSAETMYEQTLKKVLISYKNYIQEIKNDINEDEYERLDVNSFNDLIEMRDVVNAPILMHNEAKYRTKFLIVNDKRLFIYILDANLIREKLREKSKEKNEKKMNKKREEG